MFLGLESARKAIKDLVEFEPEQAERTMVILISELEAYHFLLDQFPEKDIRYQRLALREEAYGKLVSRLCDEVKAGRAAECVPSIEVSQWEPALRLIGELNHKYEGMMNRSSQPPRFAANV